MNLLTVSNPSLTGRPHLGIADTGTDLYAYTYAGGEYVSQVATVDYSAISIGSGRTIALLSLSPLAIAVAGADGVLAWNITANTVHNGGHNPPLSPVLMSGGNNGLAYWIEEPSLDKYVLYSINASGTVTRITPAAPNDEVAIAGVDVRGATFMPVAGTAYMVVYGDPGDAGRVVTSSAATAFAASDNWLPYTSTIEEWANWREGHLIPSVGGALSAYGAAGPVQLTRVSTAPAGSFVLDVSPHALGNWSPGADGLSAALYDLSQVARISLVTPAAPTWETVEDTPLGNPPDYMFCLD